MLGTVLGSALASVDATVVNIALPAIARDLHADFSALQWVSTGYTLSLASLLLIGGAMGDRFGRRRVFSIGVAWFATASLLCGIAPRIELLIAARILQGVGAALLLPGSLAILDATFQGEERGQAIGAWSGLGGVATAIGPFLGGYLIDFVSWRLIFLINLPIAIAVIWIARRHVPESRSESRGPLDGVGAGLAALGLAGVTFCIIEAPVLGWGSPWVISTGLTGTVLLTVFLLVESRRVHPMLPLHLFRDRQFSGANASTLLVYAALSGALFLLPLYLQTVVHLSALQAGMALLPITVMMLLFSARAGKWSHHIGPRIPMTLGPVLIGVAFGLLGIHYSHSQPGYWATVLPGILVMGAGLAMTVAPLTSTVLAAAPAEHAGVASAINNDVARAGGLFAVAIVPLAAGLSEAALQEPLSLALGYRRAMLLSAGLCMLGAVTAWATIRRPADER